MDVFEPAKLPLPRDASGHGYIDFFTARNLSVGYVIWPAGAEDLQQPHREDEVYYIVSGKAVVRIGGEETRVGPGSVIYVGAGVVHRFLRIEEDLRAVVFWAPPHTPSPPEASSKSPSGVGA